MTDIINKIPRPVSQGGKIPNIRELSRYSVNRPEKEGIRQSLYDYQTYGSAGATSFTFFQVPWGQSNKTYDDTNMQMAGALPSPQRFLVQSIEVYFFPGVLNSPAEDTTTALPNSQFVNDVAALNKAGNLSFSVGNKVYLQEAPIGRFPPKTRLTGNAAMATSIAGSTATSFNVTSFATFGGRPYAIEPWILLEPTQNFSVTLSFASAVSMPSSTAGRIGVVLDGILYRSAQ